MNAPSDRDLIQRAHRGGDARALQQMRLALNKVYADDVLGHDTLSIMDTLERLDPLTYIPARSAKYPGTEFGLALKQTAMLIKAEVGLEVSAIDVGGWDTHFAQGSTSGLMPNLMKDLAEGLENSITWRFQPTGRGTHLMLKFDYKIPASLLKRTKEEIVLRENEHEVDAMLQNVKSILELQPAYA